MATIKRNGDKVVLKDGKVACGCCAQPSECCMYEAEALADEFYTADDLPDAVTIGGVSYSRAGTSYGNTTNGVIFEENVWAKYKSGVRSSRPCLIQGGVEDQFANTYTLEGAIPWETYSISLDDYILTRISLCDWSGDTITISLSDYVSSGTCDVQFHLLYKDSNSDSPFTVPNWTIDYYYSNWNVFYGEDGSPVPEPGSNTIKYKASSDGISSPIGRYYRGFGFGEWEIA